MCDASTEHSITEQGSCLCCYVDPDSFKPCLKFFQLALPKGSQDARGLKKCILSAFEDHGMKDLIPKMVFLASDGASVNSEKTQASSGYCKKIFPGFHSFGVLAIDSIVTSSERRP